MYGVGSRIIFDPIHQCFYHTVSREPARAAETMPGGGKEAVVVGRLRMRVELQDALIVVVRPVWWDHLVCQTMDCKRLSTVSRKAVTSGLFALMT